jgi:hypothetical protein
MYAAPQPGGAETSVLAFPIEANRLGVPHQEGGILGKEPPLLHGTVESLLEPGEIGLA